MSMSKEQRKEVFDDLIASKVTSEMEIFEAVDKDLGIVLVRLEMICGLDPVLVLEVLNDFFGIVAKIEELDPIDDLPFPEVEHE